MTKRKAKTKEAPEPAAPEVESPAAETLQAAAAAGDIPALRRLLAAGADLAAEDGAEKAPIHRAAEAGQVEALAWLAEQGADLEAVDGGGRFAAHLAAYCGRTGVLAWLAERAPRSVFECDRLIGHRPGVYAALAGRIDVLDWLRQFDLAQHGRLRYFPDSAGESDWTPFYAAVTYDRRETMAWLVEHGADVNEKADIGRPPLYRAAMRGHVEAMAWLADRGADPEETYTNFARTPMHGAALGGGAWKALNWLPEEGGGSNVRDVEAMAWLADRGLPVTAVDHAGDTPLHLAAASGSVEAMAWLVERGADVNQSSEKDMRPVHRAALANNVEKLEWLRERGADIACEYCRAGTPLELAEVFQCKEAEAWLRRETGKG